MKPDSIAVLRRLKPDNTKNAGRGLAAGYFQSKTFARCQGTPAVAWIMRAANRSAGRVLSSRYPWRTRGCVNSQVEPSSGWLEATCR
jgi:hypothetical protein